ncbi:YihY/virulence factor BrkB family protein [Pedobacter sp. HMF7647]|uniref:YihY/virulence factor BrkB family protein n=1 Tax=Hufsiella arboris TaxID=2695275 RepID=A0A7K1Y7W8_9SPHI|nr:YihY/virulence factor BrkB family protein [Hufsiella arboris]MXV50520.1 YihY/virulence factor BrkB family protein [Hufsiella arboris]
MENQESKAVKLIKGIPVLGRLMFLALKELQLNDPLRMAGATAFFANFALPPILLLFIRLFGIFTDRRKVVSGLFEKLTSLLDPSSAQQVRETIRNLRAINQNWFLTLISFLFFLFVASTLFNVIKSSLDQIFKIGMKEKVRFFDTIKIRLKSIIIILLAGVLFFIGLLTEGVRALFGQYVTELSSTAGKLLNGTFNEIFFLLTVTIWFTALFKFLSIGRPEFRIALSGGFLTAILFTFGKYLVRALLTMSNISSVYGSAGSIIIISLFVFYSSLIFYYGACFTKVLGDYKKSPMHLARGAYNYQMREVK